MDIFQEAELRQINYNAIIADCTVKVNPLATERDISVIIPVHGRTEFNSVIQHYLKSAIDFIFPEKLISITFVEHSDYPEHENLCDKSVNYIWIPKAGKPFNKCLAHNIGALLTHTAEYFLFHDVDTMVPIDFFKKVMENIKDKDAVQTFTGRRLLYCNDLISPLIMRGSIDINKLKPDNPNIKIASPGAAGGSMMVKRDLFFDVGGYDEVFTEYSIEDQFFFDKLNLVGKLGFCDDPPIELYHLHHAPSFNRTTKDYDWNFIHSYKNLSNEEKLNWIKLESDRFKKYLPQ